LRLQDQDERVGQGHPTDEQNKIPHGERTNVNATESLNYIGSPHCDVEHKSSAQLWHVRFVV
jgi:hypothetical protein